MNIKRLTALILATILIAITPGKAIASETASSSAISTVMSVEYEITTPEEDFIYTVENGKATITGYTGGDTDITIPAEIEDYEVKTIGDELFFWNDDIERVVISEGVEIIGMFAFCGCSSLVEVVIPESLKCLSRNAFNASTSLESIYLPKDCEIEYYDEINLPFPSNLKPFIVYSYTDSYAEEYIADYVEGTGVGVYFYNLDFKPMTKMELTKEAMQLKIGDTIDVANHLVKYDKNGKEPNYATGYDVYCKVIENPYSASTNEMRTWSGTKLTFNEVGTYEVSTFANEDLENPYIFVTDRNRDSNTMTITVTDPNEISDIKIKLDNTEIESTTTINYELVAEANSYFEDGSPYYSGLSYPISYFFDKTNDRESVKWESSNRSVANVSPYSNKLYISKPGTATITARANRSGVTESFTVKVKLNTDAINQQDDKDNSKKPDNKDNDKPNKKQAKIKLNAASSIKLKLKKSCKISLASSTIKSDKIVSAVSSNSKIVGASVKSGKVVVKGKKNGRATITVKSKEGGTAKFKVTVSKKVTPKLSIKSKVSLKKGSKATLEYKLKNIAKSGKVTFKSSNKKIATVSKSTGTIKGKKKGKCRVYVYLDGKRVKTIKVNVKIK